MIYYQYMRYNIAQHASKGGIARANKINQSKRIEIARLGAIASNKKQGQARASDRDSTPEQEETYKAKYEEAQRTINIARSIFEQRGSDFDEIIDEYMIESGENDEIVD